MDAVSHRLSACHYLPDYVGAAMTWIKLDDGFPTNPKILPLSDAAFRLYIEGLCYSGKYLTDGFLNVAIVRRLGDPTELVEAGIWESIEGGFQIDGFALFKASRLPAHLWNEIRLRIFERDDYTCQYCGSHGGRLECDHVYPVAKGGGHDDENLATACFKCNRSKRDKTLDEWMAIK